MNNVEIIFQPDVKKVILKEESHKRILDIAHGCNIELSSICGGKGLCGKCKVKINSKDDSISNLTDFQGLKNYYKNRNTFTSKKDA